MPEIRFPGAIITVAGDYKPGDQAPEGYLAWHEWAEIQHEAGLRSVECGRCGKWNYPQELSAIIDTTIYKTSKGADKAIESPVCNKCTSQQGGNHGE